MSIETTLAKPYKQNLDISTDGLKLAKQHFIVNTDSWHYVGYIKTITDNAIIHLLVGCFDVKFDGTQIKYNGVTRLWPSSPCARETDCVPKSAEVVRCPTLQPAPSWRTLTPDSKRVECARCFERVARKRNAYVSHSIMRNNF